MKPTGQPESTQGPEVRTAKAGVIALVLLLLCAVVYRRSTWREPDSRPPQRSVRTPATTQSAVVIGIPRQATPSPAAESQEQLGRALTDNSIRSLLQEYRKASERRDDTTARVALQALKRRPLPAAEVLKAQLAQTQDPSLAMFYTDTLAELGK